VMHKQNQERRYLPEKLLRPIKRYKIDE